MPSSAFAHASAIKSWVREALDADRKVIVSINELSCAEPGCPPQVTVILVMQAGSRFTVSIHKALADVHEADVAEAFADHALPERSAAAMPLPH